MPSHANSAFAVLASVVALAVATPAIATPAFATPALASAVRHEDLSGDDDFDRAPVVLVHAVIRHGDRTPDEEEMELYPDNPYLGNTFYPFGLKALTNNGKSRLYRLGKQLRHGYESLLSRTYLPSQINVRTTDYDRTKMSALCLLAGLYPPEGVQLWNEDLLWQPIPYNTIPFDEDDMMYYYTCERYNQARTEELHKPLFQKRLEPYRSLFEKLNILTGRNLTTPEDIFYIDNLFQAEESYGLLIPKWATQLMPKIQEMTKIEYDLEFYTPEMKRLAGGVLTKEIADNMLAYVNGTLEPFERKMILYSAHENNVAAVMACLGVFQPHQPTFGSSLIIELRRRSSNGHYVVMIFYIRQVGQDPEALLVPNCDMMCPLERFVELIEKCLLSKAEFDLECKPQPQAIKEEKNIKTQKL